MGERLNVWRESNRSNYSSPLRSAPGSALPTTAPSSAAGAFGGPVAFAVPRAHAAELRQELTDEWKRRVANDDVLLARLASRRSSSHFVAREPQLCWEHEPEKEEWARKRRERQREQARRRASGLPWS